MDIDQDHLGKRLDVGVKILDESELSLRMLVRGVNSSMVNAWRRTIMGEVDLMAFDQLQIHENTSMMHDELLFHRLGMIPLFCPKPETFMKRAECDCDDGCPSCSAMFKLHVSNRTDITVEVTTKDLKAHCSGIKPVRDDILIAKLGKNQELSFTVFAIRSNSRTENNAKWNPATVAAFRNTADVRVDSELLNRFLSEEEQRRVCASEPAQVFVYNEQKHQTEAHPDASLRATFVGDLWKLSPILFIHQTAAATVNYLTNYGMVKLAHSKRR